VADLHQVLVGVEEVERLAGAARVGLVAGALPIADRVERIAVGNVVRANPLERRVELAAVIAKARCAQPRCPTARAGSVNPSLTRTTVKGPSGPSAENPRTRARNSALAFASFTLRIT
jgi:hypothetical protein